VAPRLRCPYCHASLIHAGRALRCAQGHSYDIARDGHVSLPAPRRRQHGGDSAEMVAAREAFLGAGHYAPIAQAIAAAAQDAVEASGGQPGCALDIGAGTGYYLAGLLKELQGWRGLALDASRPALRRAARADPRIAAVACDLWQPLPLRDGAAELVLNAFAPRNGLELTRASSRSGALIFVTPTSRHLQELVATLAMLSVDADKQARLHAKLSPALTSIGRRQVEFELALDHQDIRALIAMGPSAHHLSSDEIECRLSPLPDELLVSASVIVETFRHA